jgi:TrmH family RNA methyltransferase
MEAVTGMISKNRAKFVKSLQLKKFRHLEGAFVVEGGKSVLEVLKSDFSVVEVFVTEAFYQNHEALLTTSKAVVQIATEQELIQCGSLQTNNAGLAIVKLPGQEPIDRRPDEFVIALDDVRDPGNLGTIIRIADWYGVSKLYCSEETTDVFAPKVVQACMGSLTRVKVSYLSLEDFLSHQDCPVYGALLNGKSIYDESFATPGIILMGNESKGIAGELMKFVTHPVTIPGHGGAESLNVAVATAVICDNIRRPK